MTDAEQEWLLENWGRWDRVRRGIETCDSIEKKWKSPQEWGAPGAPVIPAAPPDREAAMAVNRAWLAMPMPYKMVLSDWYVLRLAPRKTCWRLAISRLAHDEYLARARLMCKNLLAFQRISA